MSIGRAVRGKWAQAVLVVLLVALLAGRWMAATTAEWLWAQSLGSQNTYRAVTVLRLQLAILAFAAAATWCIGNLYLIYRSIGSVQIPRRLGDLEITEAVPRRYLLFAVGVLGVLAALWVSRGSSHWWDEFALLGSRVAEPFRDPVLGLDLTYYLFKLPWLTELEGFLLRLTGTVALLSVLLYLAIGAVRKADRGLTVTDPARRHLGLLLGAFGIALFYAFYLDPGQYMGGLNLVPYDAILSDVRIPASKLLAGLSLVATAASLLWLWLPRVEIVGVCWSALLAGAVLGRYVAPAFAASANPRAREMPRAVSAVQDRLLAVAYGLEGRDTILDVPPVPDPARVVGHRGELVAGVLWDAPVLVDVLNKTVARPGERFSAAVLSVARAEGRAPTPIFLAVGESQSNSQDDGARLVAVVANAVTADGGALFLRDWDLPSQVSAQPVDVALAGGPILFSETATSFLMVPESLPVASVGLQGGLRRLALAWVLQSAALLRSGSERPRLAVVWRRVVSERLERYAPFTTFGRPYPVVAGGRLYWLAEGYLSSRAFPLSITVPWRDRRVRYLRAAFLGVVDGHSGATTLYRIADDPLGEAWARLAPDLVRPLAELPIGLRAHLRYPEEVFEIQLALKGRGTIGSLPALRPGDVQEPSWLWASFPGDPALRLRLRGAVEAGDPPVLSSVADGAAVGGRFVFRFARLVPPGSGPGLVALEEPTASGEERFGGRVRLYLCSDAVVFSRTWYRASGDQGVPVIREISFHLGSGAGSAGTPEGALMAALESLRSPVEAGARWQQLREWFRRMEAARVAGDWSAFGRAYEEIERLLFPARDTSR